MMLMLPSCLLYQFLFVNFNARFFCGLESNVTPGGDGNVVAAVYF